MLTSASGSYFENNAGEIRLDAAGFLRITWHGRPRSSETTRALFEQMLPVLRQYGWSRIFINQSQMAPFTPEEQQWIAREWLPRAVQSGYRYGAVVVSPAVLVRLATAFVTTSVQGLPLTYRSFDAEDEAVRWLLHQPANAASVG